MTISLPVRAPGQPDLVARWAIHLAGTPADVPLPHLASRTVGPYRPTSVPVPVSGSVARAAAGHWLTLFAALLCRLTGQRAVVVGSPAGTRVVAARIPAPVGPFAGADTSLWPDLPAVPPTELAGVLGRDDAAPLFDVGYVTGRQPWPSARLSLLVTDRRSARPRLGFDAGTVSTGEVTRIAARLAVLATAAVADPDAPLAELDLLTAAERERILVGFNDSARRNQDERGFADRVAEVAARTPDAVALAAAGRTVSYAGLDRRANQLARHLAAGGVRPGDAVAVLLHRSPDAVVATLAVLRAGAAVVPLDPADGDERLAYLVRDCAPAAVITTGQLTGRLPSRRRAVRAAVGEPLIVRVDADAADIAAQPVTAPAVSSGPDDVSHVVYTSGSTGPPKGVRCTHRTLTNLLNWLADDYRITGASRGSWLGAPSSPAGRMEWLPFLAAGAAVHIAGPDVPGTATSIRDWLLAERVTHAVLLTAPATDVCAVPWPADTALGHLVVFGEPVRHWPGGGLPFTVSVSYGSAEAAAVTASRWRGREEELPPAGRPIANARVYVLDGAGSPVPVGTVGEIHVAGAGVATGYLNLPAETAERFVANPLPEEPDGVLFRTGDLGRWRPDGALEVIGRRDAQTWVRDLRVDVGAAETVLAGLPEVHDVAVIARDGQLTAYVVPTGDTLPAAAVRAAAARLPAHHVPDRIVELARLPRLPGGKLDRRQLTGPPAGYREWDGPDLGPDRLRCAWHRVVDRHDELRTMIGPNGARWVIDPPARPAVPVLDLRHLPADAAERRAAAVRAELTCRRYPPWDVRLTRLPGDRLRLHLALDPAVLDRLGGPDRLLAELLAHYQPGGTP
jgi:amino acid adenylation domain-containing protein